MYDYSRVDATEVDPPRGAPGRRQRVYARDEVLIVAFQVERKRRKSPLISHYEHPDGSRSLHLHIGPPHRTGWFTWDAGRMQLEIPNRHIAATAEAHPHEGDAAIVRASQLGAAWELFEQEQRYRPGREVRIRVGGRWRHGRLLYRWRWPGGQETVLAWVWLPEPAWSTEVRYVRHYEYDRRAITPVR